MYDINTQIHVYSSPESVQRLANIYCCSYRSTHSAGYDARRQARGELYTCNNNIRVNKYGRLERDNHMRG